MIQNKTEEVRNLLNEFRARLGEAEPEDEFDKFEETFFAKDGWNESAFEEVGLMEFITNAEELGYEIRNARRGSYFRPSLEDAESLVKALHGFREILDDVIDQIDSYNY